MQPQDITPIVRYWTHATREDLARMGADPDKIRPAPELTRSLEDLYATPDAEKEVAYLVWEVDGKAIGYSSLKNIRRGVSGEMHLHVWDPTERGKGRGPTLFSLSVVEFYRRFALRSIKCEPSAKNPAPNRLLAKIGFPIVRTHTAASSELSLVCELNEYDVRLEIAERYLNIKSASA